MAFLLTQDIPVGNIKKASSQKVLTKVPAQGLGGLTPVVFELQKKCKN